MVQKMEDIEIAESLLQRLTGVIGWKDWGEKKGLLLKNAGSIHTFFVRFPLDLVFLDKDYKIIHLKQDLAPFRVSPIIWKAAHVLELPKGTIRNKPLQIGDKIDLM